MNHIFKVTLAGIASTLAFAATANRAQALDFSFSGYNAGTMSADGTISVKDAAVAAGTALQSDIEDWQINISNSASGDSVTLFGDGGSFGTDNSDIFLFPAGGASVNSSTLTFDDSFQIRNDSGGTVSATFWQGGFANRLVLNGVGANGTETSLVANASAATPVPFGTAPNMGILILGGIWGGSRLRKRMSSRA